MGLGENKSLSPREPSRPSHYRTGGLPLMCGCPCSPGTVARQSCHVRSSPPPRAHTMKGSIPQHTHSPHAPEINQPSPVSQGWREKTSFGVMVETAFPLFFCLHLSVPPSSSLFLPKYSLWHVPPFLPASPPLRLLSAVHTEVQAGPNEASQLSGFSPFSSSCSTPLTGLHSSLQGLTLTHAATHGVRTFVLTSAWKLLSEKSPKSS